MKGLVTSEPLALGFQPGDLTVGDASIFIFMANIGRKESR